VTDQRWDEVLARAEHEKLSHLEFVHALISEQAAQRRQRSIERRIHDAYFRDQGTLENFNWQFNSATIDRAWFEELATGEFVRRGDNLVQVGQSGLGKSHLIQGLGRRLCMLGYRVRYTTSAALVKDLAKSRADDSLPQRLRYYGGVDLLIIDEFGFEKLERTDCPQAANLLYKVVEARYPRRSTALVTNVDFEAWSDYLGDPPLAMAFLDRVVDGALVLKMEGESYRARRARRLDRKNGADSTTPSDGST
jgi:DNA replication protein DnaC